MLTRLCTTCTPPPLIILGARGYGLSIRRRPPCALPPTRARSRARCKQAAVRYGGALGITLTRCTCPTCDHPPGPLEVLTDGIDFVSTVIDVAPPGPVPDLRELLDQTMWRRVRGTLAIHRAADQP